MEKLPTDPGTFKKYMYGEIKQRLLTWRFEKQEMTFLPRGRFEGLLGTLGQWCKHLNTRVPEFQKDPNNFSGRILTTNTKFFCIAIYSQLTFDALLELLSANDLDDQALPFSKGMLDRLQADKISTTKRKDFLRYQYYFSPVGFTSGEFEQVISEQLPIPIEGTLETDMVATGAQAGIFGVEIFSRHHDFSVINGLVLKRILCPKVAKREIAALNVLHDRPLISFAKIYSGFQFKEKKYLIAERARESLRAFMESPCPSHGDEKWLHSRFKDLAGALKHLHEDLPKYIIHHDIKPDNILIFTVDRTENVMRITDWGCASVHPHRASGEDQPRSENRGNPPYHPPECEGRALTTCAHDIWALGCVFLELLIWYHEGVEAHKSFRSARRAEGSLNWYVDKNYPKTPGEDPINIGDLLPVIRTKLDNLEKSTWKGECKILSRMLEIDPNQRITAGDLVDELDQLMQITES